MDPLGHQAAEVDGGSGDGLGGALGTPRPLPPVGSGEADAERLGRRGAPVHGEREVAGADTEMGNVAQPVGGGPGDAQRVGHVGAVRPGLHQPRRGHRSRAHGRAVPDDPGPGRNGREGVGEGASRRAPVGEQFGRRPAGLLPRPVVDEAVRVGDLAEPGDERLRVFDGGEGGPIGPQQMPDLVGDGPALGGRHSRPALVREVGDEGIEVLALGTQIVEKRLQLRHATRVTLAARKSKLS
ncbi:hypothetical protein RHRU231_450060 [Rhodococcus ruber]|uniref:Uncharacterized protein n=1 Tax=Rhodococcus ruber TaxID=1830 RepID=A0A098BJL7_9NOCA|nr:hypothetical protein RHRU231_450060 [Rhodococcus ruber]